MANYWRLAIYFGFFYYSLRPLFLRLLLFIINSEYQHVASIFYLIRAQIWLRTTLSYVPTTQLFGSLYDVRLFDTDVRGLSLPLIT